VVKSGERYYVRSVFFNALHICHKRGVARARCIRPERFVDLVVVLRRSATKRDGGRRRIRSISSRRNPGRFNLNRPPLSPAPIVRRFHCLVTRQSEAPNGFSFLSRRRVARLKDVSKITTVLCVGILSPGATRYLPGDLDAEHTTLQCIQSDSFIKGRHGTRLSVLNVTKRIDFDSAR